MFIFIIFLSSNKKTKVKYSFFSLKYYHTHCSQFLNVQRECQKIKYNIINAFDYMGNRFWNRF